ncbi:transglutaminase-like domain-containing protein [Teredinibacter turnerae]|uniref:transglutaminase-like domain-containing protein n=1 Tax=Teredinibacter turnerae TaxID=2426 RepID=UPI00041975F5|nr:transglutaminase-like domain-containing protein [Teredinibacter turnerae]
MIVHEIKGVALTGAIRGAQRALRVFAWLMSLLFMNALLVPHVYAIRDGIEKEERRKAMEYYGTPDQVMNQALLKLQRLAADKNHTLSSRIAEKNSWLDSLLSYVRLNYLQLENLEQVVEVKQKIEEMNTLAMEGFANTGRYLADHNMPPDIVHRHERAVQNYQSHYAATMAGVDAALNAKNLQAQGEAIHALHSRLKNQKLTSTHEAEDPARMPWGVPNAHQVREPVTSADQLAKATGFSPVPKGLLLAANVITPEMLGNLGGPDTDDLAETVDVQFTQAIRLKALELGEDPVQIYNWVRNNIEFIPSYGSIQGADYTLQLGKGNAFDIASLLIALLRVSNIPARYAYGTVDIPAEKVMNWVGGVSVPAAAQQLLGQGGIPNTGLVSGGEVKTIRMEQMWVEAWVDYFPSRGEKHSVGDQWVPMDASFKQYQYTTGIDPTLAVEVDSEALVTAVNDGATRDEAAGWTQGQQLDVADVALQSYQAELEAFLATVPDLSVESGLGSQKVIQQAHVQLAAGLPYTLVARTHNYATLPANLRHTFQYRLSTEYSGYEGSNLIAFEAPLAELAGKKIALSFKPSTEADENLLRSYLPASAGSGPIDPSQLPSTLPGYLINLTAELTIDEEVVQSVAAGNMGEGLYEKIGLRSPSFGVESAVNHPVVGEYRAFGLSLQGVSSAEATDIETRLKETRDQIEALAEDELVDFSKHQLVGDTLHAVIYSYFLFNEALDSRNANASGVVSYRAPSFGLFGSSLQTSYWFGMPRNVAFSGLVMDVDHLAMLAAAKTNAREASVEYVKSSGVIASAMEHLVPELMLSTEEAPAEGISAVKALMLASSAGQKIWTIDKNNVDVALAEINLHADIETEIRNSVYAGNVATAHEQPVAFAGSTATGYLLINPQTGAGAYKISGGLNGGLLEWLDENAYWLGGLAFVLGIVGGGWAIAGVLLGIAVAIAGITQFANSNPDPDLLLLYIGLMAMFVLLGAIVGAAGGALFALWIFGFIADGAIRTAQQAIDALRGRQTP